MGCKRTTMNLPMGRRRWKGGHAHAAAKERCRCYCESYFVVNRHVNPHVKNDDGGAAPSTRNGTKSAVVQRCWAVVREGGDKNDCSSMSAYGNGTCPSLSAELLVGALAVNWQLGSRTLEKET